MCLICEGISVNKLTPWEAVKNRKEMIELLDEDHLVVLDRKIEEHLIKYLENMTDFGLKRSDRLKK